VICLRKYDQCCVALLAMLGSQLLVQRWWAGANSAFENRTPWQVYRVDPQRVCDYVLEQLQP
jgi:hypothetical protein